MGASVGGAHLKVLEIYPARKGQADIENVDRSEPTSDYTPLIQLVT